MNRTGLCQVDLSKIAEIQQQKAGGAAGVKRNSEEVDSMLTDDQTILKLKFKLRKLKSENEQLK